MSIRRQRPVKGGRLRAGTGLIKELERRIRADMREFGASRSMVIAVALGIFYRVSEQERFEDDPTAWRAGRRRRLRLVGKRPA